MPARPTQTERVARAAAARHLVGDSISGLGWGLAAGSAAALVAVGVDKLWTPVPVAAYAVVIAAGVAVPLVRAVARRWSVQRAAAELDARLGLKDRLATALALAASPDAFGRWSIAESESLASQVDVARAIPVRWGRMWAVWPAILGAAIGAWWLAPRWERPAPALRPAATAEERARAAEEIRQAARAVEQTVADTPITPATAKQLADLDRLEQELAEGTISPDEARTRTASAIDQAADELERQREREAAAADGVRERLAEAVRSSDTEPGPESPASELREALSQGDLRAAAEAAAKAVEAEPTLTPAEREDLARELDRLAEALESGGGDQPATPEAGGESPPDPQPAPGDAPAQERGTSPPGQANPEEKVQRESLQEALREASKDLRQSEDAPPRTTPPEAEPPPPQPPPPAGDRQPPATGATGPSGATSDQTTTPRPPDGSPSGSTGATSSQEPPPSPDSPPQGQSGATGAATGQTGSTSGSPSPQPSATGSTGAQPSTSSLPATGASGQTGATSSPQPGQSGATSGATGSTGNSPQQMPESGGTGPTGATSQPQSGQSGATSGATGSTGTPPQQMPESGGTGPNGATSQPQPGQPGATSSSGPSGSTGATPQPTPASGGTGPTGAAPEPGATGASSASGSTGGDGTQVRPSPSPDAAPDGQPTGNGREQGGRTPPGGGLDRVAKELRELANRGRPDAQPDQKLRDMARKMLEDSTPEQREELRRLAQELSRPPQAAPPAARAPSQTTPAGVRPTTISGDRPRERTIAEWYSDRPDPASGPATFSESVRQAAQGAERAIEQQQVPARHQDLVRRVFKRYADQPAPPK